MSHDLLTGGKEIEW